MAQNPRDSKGGPDPGDQTGTDGSGAAANQPGAAADAPPAGQKPGFWQRWRAAPEGEAAAPGSKCVIMGPLESGKTLLLMSLEPCAMVQSHSYAGRFDAMIGGQNEDFRKIEGWLDGAFEKGLALDATDIGTCFRPEFTLFVTNMPGSPRYASNTRFSTFDGSGGLLEDELAAGSPAAKKCREMLDGALNDCDTVLLCLPIMKDVAVKQERALKEFLLRFMLRPRIRQLVVCFTMYEALALQGNPGLGRNAYRVLATRTAARKHMAEALSNRLSAVDNVLRQFQVRDRTRKVWCLPVSTYGFVPHNGGANLARVRITQNGRIMDDAILRTRPARQDTPPTAPDPERPYDRDKVRKDFWHPFLTLDPFIFIATGERSGTLIHSYDELWK